MYQNDETLDIERQSVGKDLWVLADAIPYRKTFRTELRKRLMVQARALDAEALDIEKEVRTLGTTSQDKGDARSPSWLQRLAQGVGRINQIFEGGLTMKKGFALAAIAALVIAVSTVAFVPSVRAQVGEILNTWFRFKSPGGEYEVALSGPAEFAPLHPTYLPAGLQSGGGGISVSETGGGSESVELTYHNDEQFVTIIQSKVPADEMLPTGREVTVNGQPAVLVTGLEGAFEYGFRIPEDAQVETFGTPPAEPAPYHGTIAYTDGKRLTWYVGDVKVEMLSNLPDAEMLKVAESMMPAEAGESEAPFQPPLNLPVVREEGIIIQEGPTESSP
ncbi:MAG: hypothetical protein KAX26_12015 [Anaerolineae bacterium]|nr:hypothetical protein [Anaerolineae bacterium]